MKRYTVVSFEGPNVYGLSSLVCVRAEDFGPVTLKTSQILEIADALLPRLSSGQAVKDCLAEKIGDRETVGWAEAIGFLGLVLQDDLFLTPLKSFVPEKRYTDRVEICFECNEPRVGVVAARFACAIVSILGETGPGPLPPNAVAHLKKAKADFVKGVRARRMNENMRILVQAAKERSIPYFLPEPPQKIVEFGYGKNRVRMLETMADTTGAIAVTFISRDKWNTARTLEAAALPVPRHILIKTEAEALAAVERLGTPVVVKGRTGDKGETVTANIETKSALKTAIQKVPPRHRPVLIEEFIRGDDYRFTVVDGRMVAAARRIPAHVTGDGRSTVSALIESENQKRKTMGRYAYWLTPLAIDKDSLAALSVQNLEPGSVPENGRRVYLRRAANISIGGTAEDVTDIAHPDVIDTAERAALAVGLDLAGVDIITTDVTKPLSQTGGAVIEVNEFPGLVPHYITVPTHQDPAGDMMDYLFKDRNGGRIPTVAVTGTNGKTTVSSLLYRLLMRAGLFTGTATSNGIFLNGQKVGFGDCAGSRYAKMVLRDPRVEAGVFEIARRSLVRAGLRFDGSSVSVVTNVSDDHLGFDGIHSLEEMARVKRLVAEGARDGVVLNADDPLVAAMAGHVRAPVWWVSREPGSARIRDHVAAAGHAVVLTGEDADQEIVWLRGTDREPIIKVHEIPGTFEGRLQINADNAAFAAAAALALKQDMAQVRAMLKDFTTDPDVTLGRFNTHTVDGITIISDYAHNEDGLIKACAFLEKLEVKGRRLCYFGAVTGERQDDYYDNTTRVIAPHFDIFYVGEADVENGRPRGEVVRLLHAGLLNAGADAARVHKTLDERDGVKDVLNAARPGDLVFLTTRHHAKTWEQITAFKPKTG